MGYTRYWTRTEKPITQEFVDAVNEIITNERKKGITICGWDGTGEPEVTLERIALNGPEENDLGHESFVITKESAWDFCKTAYKPYDYVVREVLKVGEKMGIVADVSSDGDFEEIVSDADYLKGGWW